MISSKKSIFKLQIRVSKYNWEIGADPGNEYINSYIYRTYTQNN